MSDRDHREAMRLHEAICVEIGECVPFARVCLMALEMLLSELREERERLREPDAEQPVRRYA